MAKLRRKRSLRDRAFVVALLIGAAPFVFLVSMTRVELYQARLVSARTQATLDLVAQHRAANEPWAEIERWLRDAPEAENQRVRALTRAGALIFDVDRSLERGPMQRLDELLYGPVGPALSSVEAQAGPLSQRPESLSAEGHDERFAPGGNVLLHTANRWHEDVQLHVQAFSRRAVLPQLTQERQIIKWVSASIAVAVLAGWLLSRQLIKPLEQLRQALLERASLALPQARLTLDRRDEVGDVANAFNTLLTALEQRTKANEAFLTDLAHELKNPVAAIRSCADLMASGALSPDRAAALTDVLRTSSAQLDRLVTQFLELSRAEAGLPSELRERVSVHALLDGLRRTFAADPRFTSVQWRGEWSATPDETVLAVPSRLERAFSNLMLNALSFAGEAGWVRIDLRSREAEVEVEIGDSGPGIEPAQLQHLFERFHTTRGDEKGTGLGLAMTRAIVEAHGGTITVSSPPSGGASFTVRLPRG